MVPHFSYKGGNTRLGPNSAMLSAEYIHTASYCNVHQLFFIYGEGRCESPYCGDRRSQLSVIRLFSRDCAAYLPTVA